jgi:hypothetical protein
MNDQPAPNREICVAIDMRGISHQLLDTMVLIAESLETSLVGLFVQDILLQQVAELPFTTEVSRGTGEERELAAPRLQQQLNRQFDALQKYLARQSEARQVRYRMDTSPQKPAFKTLCSPARDVFLPGRGRAKKTAKADKPLARVKLFYDGSEQSLRAWRLLAEWVSRGLTRQAIIVSHQAIPAGLLHELVGRGAKLLLVHSEPTSAALLHDLSDGPVSELQLLPLTLAETLDEQLLERALDYSRAGATFVVT